MEQSTQYNVEELDVSTWFERDRAMVHLFAGDENTTVLCWWDDDVQQAVEDGFLDPHDWKGSAIKYAVELGFAS